MKNTVLSGIRKLVLFSVVAVLVSGNCDAIAIVNSALLSRYCE